MPLTGSACDGMLMIKAEEGHDTAKFCPGSKFMRKATILMALAAVQAFAQQLPAQAPDVAPLQSLFQEASHRQVRIYYGGTSLEASTDTYYRWFEALKRQYGDSGEWHFYPGPWTNQATGPYQGWDQQRYGGLGLARLRGNSGSSPITINVPRTNKIVVRYSTESNGGSFSISVDGVAQGAINCNGAQSYNNEYVVNFSTVQPCVVTINPPISGYAYFEALSTYTGDNGIGVIEGAVAGSSIPNFFIYSSTDVGYVAPIQPVAQFAGFDSYMLAQNTAKADLIIFAWCVNDAGGGHDISEYYQPAVDRLVTQARKNGQQVLFLIEPGGAHCVPGASTGNENNARYTAIRDLLLSYASQPNVTVIDWNAMLQPPTTMVLSDWQTWANTWYVGVTIRSLSPLVYTGDWRHCIDQAYSQPLQRLHELSSTPAIGEPAGTRFAPFTLDRMTASSALLGSAGGVVKNVTDNLGQPQILRSQGSSLSIFNFPFWPESLWVSDTMKSLDNGANRDIAAAGTSDAYGPYKDYGSGQGYYPTFPVDASRNPLVSAGTKFTVTAIVDSASFWGIDVYDYHNQEHLVGYDGTKNIGRSGTLRFWNDGSAVAFISRPTVVHGTFVAENSSGNSTPYMVFRGKIYAMYFTPTDYPVIPLPLPGGLASAPQIQSQPGSQTALPGQTAVFAVVASGTPSPTYQWQRQASGVSTFVNLADDNTYTGSTTASLSVKVASISQNGDQFQCVVGNGVSPAALSSTATVNVVARSYAGTYFGTFGPGLGNFALYIRPANKGVFLGFLPGSGTAIVNLNLAVDDSGSFTLSQAAATAGTTIGISGTIGPDGSVTGTVSGMTGAQLAGALSPAGATQTLAGFYQFGAINSSATSWCILGSSGQACVVIHTAAGGDGGQGTVDNIGHVAVVTSKQSTFRSSVTSGTALVTATVTDSKNAATTYTGTNDAALALQRLASISSRARVGTGDLVAIAGFVISGQDPKQVLIRAAGPALAGLGVSGALTATKLELYQGSAVIATNTGWSGGGNNVAVIGAAAASVGAFPFAANSGDAAILTTLTPGTYSAILSSANGAQGVGLVEVYDLSNTVAGQKLVSISTRAFASAGDNALIAGVYISGAAAKKVLIRAVGPGLAPYNVSGVLAQPQLTLYTNSQVIAQNAGWSTSPDAAEIATVSAQVQAFPLVPGSADAALLINLVSGGYTALVTGAGGASGNCLVEIYEVP